MECISFSAQEIYFPFPLWIAIYLYVLHPLFHLGNPLATGSSATTGLESIPYSLSVIYVVFDLWKISCFLYMEYIPFSKQNQVTGEYCFVPVYGIIGVIGQGCVNGTLLVYVTVVWLH